MTDDVTPIGIRWTRHPRRDGKLDVWSMPEPTDLMVWSVCPYLRSAGERCLGCPPWEDFDGDQCKRGCRMLAEEACRTVLAARQEKFV